MILSLILSVALSDSIAQTPPPEITHVQSRAFCTALRQNIAVSVYGLMTNDKVVQRSEVVLSKMGRDVANSGGGAASGTDPHVTLDQAYLGSLVGTMVHNLEVVDKLLDNELFSANPKTDEEKKLANMKAKLLAIAKQQREALNVMSGTIETQQLGALQHDNTNAAIGSATGHDTDGHQGLAPASGDQTHLFDAGLNSAPPGWVQEEQLADNLAVGAGTYAPLVHEVGKIQARTRETEAPLAQSIVDGVQSCK